jgi:cytochrome c5
MKRKNILLILYVAIVSLGFARIVQRSVRAASNPRLTEAPAAFATPLLAQNPGSQSVSNGIPEPPNDTFALDQAKFEGRDGNDTGLGPVYNATSCADCHQNPVTGGTSQTTEASRWTPRREWEFRQSHNHD